VLGCGLHQLWVSGRIEFVGVGGRVSGRGVSLEIGGLGRVGSGSRLGGGLSASQSDLMSANTIISGQGQGHGRGHGCGKGSQLGNRQSSGGQGRWLGRVGVGSPVEVVVVGVGTGSWS
jgi:hypothetical protein